MAVAGQAALLDELMGKRRNVSLREVRPPHWSDEDNCVYFMAGLCPNDLFNNTKDDLGPCEKVHDDGLLERYRGSRRCGAVGYEEQLCGYLRALLSSVESRIRRGETRLRRNGSLVHSSYSCEREEELGEVTVKIEEALCEVERLGTAGEVERSRAWLEVAEGLKAERERLERSIEAHSLQAKELEVCRTCGAFQVRGDALQRLEEHLQGKMHLGYARIREYLATRGSEKVAYREDKWNRSLSREREKSKKIEVNNKKEKIRKKEKDKNDNKDNDNNNNNTEKNKNLKRRRSKSVEKREVHRNSNSKTCESINNQGNKSKKHSKSTRRSKSPQHHRHHHKQQRYNYK